MSDITLGASANAFTEIFKDVRDHFTFSKSDSANFGPFSASYSVALHLQDGNLALNDDNTIEVTDLEIVWDTLKVEVCFNLPGWCVGGFCIVPDPWNGCLVNFPGFCIGGPICAPLDFSGIVSEITDLKANLVATYYVDPARQLGWSDLDAEFNGHPNKWRIFINPVFIHVDPIDIPATAANLLENAVKDAIDALIPSWVPSWAVDLLWAIIGPILDFVTGILGIVGDFEDWLSNLLGSTFDLLGAIETAVADYFASQNPIYEFEDPYPVLPASGGLIPVKVPIRDLAASVNSKEMVVTADIGA
jgi:hypothetical protein